MKNPYFYFRNVLVLNLWKIQNINSNVKYFFVSLVILDLKVTDRSLEAGTFRKFQLVERPVSNTVHQLVRYYFHCFFFSIFVAMV